MNNKEIFEDIVSSPRKWLLDDRIADNYKRALSVLIEENHTDPYQLLLNIIETEVHKRVSEKILEVTEKCAEDYKKKT